MRKTFGSLFSGGGGADIGAKAAGLELAWGVEYVPEIAEVANANLGRHIKVANILDCNPFDFDRVDVLHASPPCPSFSVAKAGGVETELDIALARRVAEFATVLQPQVFTLENVHAYQKSKSWRIIEGALYEAGYWLSVSIVNFADMGVAQTRKRMIVRAVRGGFVPYLPQPERWVGWYEAIEDILHTLPDSRFADWQLARLPEEIKQTLMLWNMDQTARDVTVRYADQPVPTVDTGMMRRPSSVPQAVLIDSKNVNQEYGKLYRNADEPALTVTTDGKPSHMPRTFLVSKHYDAPSSADVCHVQVKRIGEPSMTVTASDKIECRAFIVDCQKAGDTTGDRGVTIRNGDEPCFTLTSGTGQRRPARAYDGTGRVVAMTARALARFQSFPDQYLLPESKTLAAKVIGNAVPPLGYQKIIGGLL